MSWVKLDDRIFLNPKFRAKEATTEARMLYIAGLAFSAQAESDGEILATDIPLVLSYARISGPDAAVAALVKLGLWRHTTEGYQIHDYLEYQPSHAHLNSERERKRQAAASRRAAEKAATVLPRGDDRDSSAATSAATGAACSNVPPRPVRIPPDLPIGGSKRDLLSSNMGPRLSALPSAHEIDEINSNAIGFETNERTP